MSETTVKYHVEIFTRGEWQPLEGFAPDAELEYIAGARDVFEAHNEPTRVIKTTVTEEVHWASPTQP